MNDTYECSYIEVLENIKKSEYSCEKKESVYMNDKMKGYIEEVRRNIGKPFDLEKFFNHVFSEDEEETDYGASVIITPNQVITIPNIENYRGYHIYTVEPVVAEIYELPEELTFSNESELLVEKNIQMRLINEWEEKKIVIFFPKKITQGHIDLLRAYQNTYGEIVKEISIRYENEGKYRSPIVLCAHSSGDDAYRHSFEKAIEYAQTLPRVEEQEPLQEFILGQVISPDGLTLCNSRELKSLNSLNDEALNKGVTTADCNSFWGNIKSWWKKIRGDR